MAVKPLKDLLKEADSFCRGLGITKSASPQAAVTDGVSDLVSDLLGAESVVADDGGFEKAAMSLNRAEALLQIQTLQKLATFKERALEDGHSEQQVNEAIDKIAAKKIRENLVTLTAIDGLSDPSKDKNTLIKKKVPAQEIGQAPRDLELTRSLGHGR
jgi:hypothetical protein